VANLSFIRVRRNASLAATATGTTAFGHIKATLRGPVRELRRSAIGELCMESGVKIFISFKNLDPTGKSTRDSVLALEVYEFLVAQGLKVFFSNVSLENLGFAAFKKAIDEALGQAQILIAVGTSGENLESQWVRYEWDSFANDILSDYKPEGRIFVYVENTSISSLPRALRQSQVFVHGPGSLERLYNFIANALGKPLINIDAKLTEITDCLCHVLSRDEAWRIGLVETWLARDMNRLISRIVADWDHVTPAACAELERLGWEGGSYQMEKK
jgi:hypothetical protein